MAYFPLHARAVNKQKQLPVKPNERRVQSEACCVPPNANVTCGFKINKSTSGGGREWGDCMSTQQGRKVPSLPYRAKKKKKKKIRAHTDILCFFWCFLFCFVFVCNSSFLFPVRKSPFFSFSLLSPSEESKCRKLSGVRNRKHLQRRAEQPEWGLA